MGESKQVAQIKSGDYLRIKVCGMRDATNVAELLTLPIDFMGLIFYPPSPRFVEAGAQVPMQQKVGIHRVGVFVDAPLEEVIEKVDRFALDMVQLHGQESLFYCQQLQKKGIPIIKAFAVHDRFQFSITKAYELVCDYFLFDTKGAQPGGNGTSFNWALLDAYEGQLPFFLSGGIRPDMAESIIAFEHPQLFGIDINSGFESRPGMKAMDKITQFLQAIDSKESTLDDYNNIK